MALARNALFNLMGAALPAVLSVLTIPYIVRSLGTADFGLLTLVTAIVGYFALLDVNLTAGTTKYVAGFHATADANALHQTVTFGLAIYVGIGLAGMAGLLLFAEPLVRHVFSVPADRQTNAVLAVQVASIGFLFGQMQAYLQSLPGAMMRYDVSGRIEAAFGTAVPLCTVALLALGGDLVGVVALRVVMSAVQLMVLVFALRRLVPRFRPTWPPQALRAQLLGFSAYAFLSKLASLTHSNADKLLIGHHLGVAAVTFYAVPSTLTSRVMGLVSRLSGVMFPHASAMAAAGRIDDLRRHYFLGTRYLFFINGAIALILVAFAQPLLTLWIGPEFAQQGAQVMILVALAQWVDSWTNLPSLVNDGLGHPRVTGTLALVRAVFGLLLIFIGLQQFGIVGAAAGHLAASLTMGTVFLVYVHGRTVPVVLGDLLRQTVVSPLIILFVMSCIGVLLAPFVTSWFRLIGVFVPLIALVIAVAWRFVVMPDHRRQLRGLLPWNRAGADQ